MALDYDISTPIWEHDLFSGLVDHETGAVGRVVSSEKEPAGSHTFYFWADDEALTLDVGHIVVTFSEEAAVIGVIDEPRRYSDLRSFLDDYFDRRMELAMPEEGPTRRPEILVFTVNVLATKHLRDDVSSNRPAVNGAVFFATGEAIRYALGVHGFTGTPIPALMHTNGNYVRDEETGAIVEDKDGRPRFQKTPLFLDEDYLLGPEAGHANWTGQSGLATKTSHALFLTSSVFQAMEHKGKTVAALMFNVKGPDLLWLDKPAKPDPGMEDAYRAVGWDRFDEDQEHAYKALGLEVRPFENFNIFAPFRPGMTPPSVNKRVDLSGFNDYKALNTPRQKSSECSRVFPILWSLRQALRYPHKLFSFSDLDDKLFGFIYELREQKIESFDDLSALFVEIQTYFDDPNNGDYWRGHHKATIRKAQNRFNGLKDKFGGLLGDGVVDYGTQVQVDHDFKNQEIRVVDISQCNSNVQELIVANTIQRVWDMAENGNMGVDKLIVFVDELNKYAPAGGEGGLRDTLIDIAARGRHLNVVLLGAQQFRSKVDGEVLGNCGTSFYGRVGDEEIINAAYRSISNTTKHELLGLAKGRMLVRHAHYRAPLFGTFPLPPTIPGAKGQRIFGDEETAHGNPGDPIFRMLQRYMGDNAPSRAEVLSECEGLDKDDIEYVRQQCEKVFRTHSNGRGNPWRATSRELRNRRTQKQMS